MWYMRDVEFENKNHQFVDYYYIFNEVSVNRASINLPQTQRSYLGYKSNAAGHFLSLVLLLLSKFVHLPFLLREDIYYLKEYF